LGAARRQSNGALGGAPRPALAVDARGARAQAATSAPLIERSIERATGIVYNITGGKDLTLSEVNRVSEVVTALADPGANVIFGAVIDDAYAGEVHVTIIATGFAQSFEEGLLSGKTPVSAGRGWQVWS